MSKFLSRLNIATSLKNNANNPVFLDSAGKIPALDGSQLTDVVGTGSAIFDSTVANYFNLYATTATSRRKQAVNDFVEALKEQGIWDLLYTVWINSGDTEVNIGKVLKGTNGTLSRVLTAEELKANGGLITSTTLTIYWGTPILDTNYSTGYAISSCSDSANLKSLLLLGQEDAPPGAGIGIAQSSSLNFFPAINYVAYGNDKIEAQEIGGFYVTYLATGLYPFRAGVPKTYSATVPLALNSSSTFSLTLSSEDGIAATIYGQALTKAQASKVSQLLDELSKKF